MNEQSELVRCISSHTYAQRPVSFTYKDREYQVKQMIAEWREPSEKSFIVLSECGQRFKLSFDYEEQVWRIQPEPGETPTHITDQECRYG